MDNKKILVSFMLVVLIALSLSSVSAQDVGEAVAVDDAAAEVVAVDNVPAEVVAVDDAVAEVVAVDDAAASDVLANTYKPAANTVDAVQEAIDAANATDTIDLSDYAEYDFGSSNVKIAKDNVVFKGNGTTLIKGWGANDAGKGNALIEVTGSNVTIQGITFLDTHPKNNFTYGGTVYGAAVRFQGVTGGLLSDCVFNEFNSAAIVQRSTLVVLEDNFVRGGYTTVIANDPTVNVETGSKSFNIYGQSSQITVRGNTFDGQILDGVSIAQGSGSNIVENNIFIGNTYSIYFGGASTKNSVVRNNKFVNCGYFKEGDVEWTDLPVISIQKASNDIAIENNNFTVLSNSVLIAAEQGNEAHGFPSSLGNINVTGNTVELATGATGKSVVLFHVLCRDGTALNLTAPLKVKDNQLAEGVREYVVWYTAWGNETKLLNNTASDLQAVIDAANPGAVIDLSYVDNFDFGADSVTIAKDNITLIGGNTYIVGNGANDQGKGNALIEVKGSNVVIKGFIFVDVNPNNVFKYNGAVYGAAVRFQGVNGGLLTNCTFYDFNSAAIVQRSSLVVLENNYIKGGYTTFIANDPTVNVETGSKSFNIYGQSSEITVRGNTFDGQILDGISIAQGSGSNIVENNTFIGNTYSIYFGGASTKNSVVRNNKFINCGYFEEGEIVWTNLPIISIQKASNDIALTDNTFIALSNSVLIAAEQGNEAHGFPSSLGNINVTGNTVELANGTNPSTVILFNIFCRNGDLNLSAPINVTGNTVADGVKVVSLQTSGDTYFDVDPVPPAPPEPILPTPTIIVVKDIKLYAGDTGKLSVTLEDIYGNKLANQTVTIFVNNEVLVMGKTNSNGVLSKNVKYASAGVKYATVAFLDTNFVYAPSVETAKITVIKKTTALTVASKVNVIVKKAKVVSVTLKANKKAVAKKQVTITVNGKTYKAITNSKGVAKISIKVLKKGTYKATVKFAGDAALKAVIKKINVVAK